MLAVPSSSVALRLLEGVVDRDGKGWVRLLGEAMHRLRHAVKEEASAFSLLPWRYGVATSSSPWHGERGEEIREDRFSERRSQT